MVEADKEDNFDFTPEGEALGYISLDQARFLAIQHARANPEFYGRRYTRQALVQEVASSEESEDYYQVRLSYRPAGRFRGQPGVEQYLIEKTGEVRLRQLLDEPSGERRRRVLLLLTAFLLGAIGITLGGLYAVTVDVFAERVESYTETEEYTVTEPYTAIEQYTEREPYTVQVPKPLAYRVVKENSYRSGVFDVADYQDVSIPYSPFG